MQMKETGKNNDVKGGRTERGKRHKTESPSVG